MRRFWTVIAWLLLGPAKPFLDKPPRKDEHDLGYEQGYEAP